MAGLPGAETILREQMRQPIQPGVPLEKLAVEKPKAGAPQLTEPSEFVSELTQPVTGGYVPSPMSYAPTAQELAGMPYEQLMSLGAPLATEYGLQPALTAAAQPYFEGRIPTPDELARQGLEFADLQQQFEESRYRWKLYKERELPVVLSELETRGTKAEADQANAELEKLMADVERALYEEDPSLLTDQKLWAIKAAIAAQQYAAENQGREPESTHRQILDASQLYYQTETAPTHVYYHGTSGGAAPGGGVTAGGRPITSTQAESAFKRIKSELMDYREAPVGDYLELWEKVQVMLQDMGEYAQSGTYNSQLSQLLELAYNAAKKVGETTDFDAQYPQAPGAASTGGTPPKVQSQPRAGVRKPAP